MDMKQGFYFFTPKMEYFFVTSQSRRTESFCELVESKLKDLGCTSVFDGKYHGMFGNFSIHDKLEPATLEVKHTNKFGAYYDVKGSSFSAGSFVSEKKLTIVELD